MRSIFMTVTFAAAAFAQDQQSLPSTLRRSLHRLVQQATKPPVRPRKILAVVVESKPCAIALATISPEQNRTHIATVVPGPGKFTGKEVQPPAPSCDDMKK